jgi:predicted TIM-barrel enzyme
MTKAGADIIVVHLGLPAIRLLNGNAAKVLEQKTGDVLAIAQAAKSLRKDVIVLCHGGPIATSNDASAILQKCPELDGFVASGSPGSDPADKSLAPEGGRYAALKFGRH